MDNERLTWNEIAAKYPDKWVGLSQIDWEDDSNIRSAVVIGTSNSDHAFLPRQIAGEDVFTRYTCPWNLY
ncbi:MAG: hypothetical protein IJ849_11910 [Selenomonadaceae bacterium]|nr:hypothetical protein [Selenomonadaceae bacterium]